MFNIIRKREPPALEAVKSLYGPTFAVNNKNDHRHRWMTMMIMTLVVLGDYGVKSQRRFHHDNKRRLKFNEHLFYTRNAHCIVAVCLFGPLVLSCRLLLVEEDALF